MIAKLISKGTRCVEDPPPDDISISRCNNDLGTRIYKSLVHGSSRQTSNLVVSPFSLLSVLTLAMRGTKGITSHQIRDALNLPCDKETLYYQKYSNILNKLFLPQLQGHMPDTDFSLDSANRIYVDKSLELHHDFVKRSNGSRELSLNSAVAVVDFSHDSKKAISNINDWVKEKTRGKIINLLNQDSVNANTKMVLVNSLYLNATWITPFEQISPKDFYYHNKAIGLDGKGDSNSHFHTTYKKVPTMEAISDFKTGTLSWPFNADIIELPYRTSASITASMIILIPTEKNITNGEYPLSMMEKEFNTIILNQVPNFLSNQNTEENRVFVRVEMPKFEIESQIDLKATLSGLGVDAMFDHKRCDFSRMIHNVGREVSVDTVIQKCFVNVDLHGTEAAVATATASKSSYAKPYQKEFIINRPFMFIIRVGSANDPKEGANLFMGRIHEL